MRSTTRRDQLAGAFWGLLVGDALGVPYEFHPAAEIPSPEEIEMAPPAGFQRAHPSVPPGTWSDDGAQALCLLASLLHCGQLDPEDLGQRFVDWFRHGYLAVEGHVYDCGVTTARALSAIEDGTPATEAGPSGEWDNGNGALMRVLPLALWHDGPDTALVRDAMDQSRVTHGHLRSQLCCALYCLWARRELARHPSPWPDAVETLRAIVADDDAALSELTGPIGIDDPPEPQGSGYVVDCLHSARHATLAEDFETVVRRAIALGRDTDTTAAVAGGIAGLRWGVEAIPQRWRDALRGRALAEPLLQQLLETSAP